MDLELNESRSSTRCNRWPESRPNVAADAAALCFKESGNTLILRGGSESFSFFINNCEYNKESYEKFGLPSGVLQNIPTVDRIGLQSVIC